MGVAEYKILQISPYNTFLDVAQTTELPQIKFLTLSSNREFDELPSQYTEFSISERSISQIIDNSRSNFRFLNRKN